MLARADLSKVGISDEHAILLRKLARAIVGKRLIFSTLQGLGQIVSQLIDICEIDDSTVNYIAMRAFGEPDAFPAGEFERRFLLKGPPLSGERVTRVTEEWRPWRA
jgi:3-methyladenine DNA glycosylase/8-oxoguanine DNA glycosylase